MNIYGLLYQLAEGGGGWVLILSPIYVTLIVCLIVANRRG